MENPISFDIRDDELEIFLEDVNEHIGAMESGVLNMEKAADPDTLNAIFRAAHTLKAVAAAVGHRRMAELTHTVETLFDSMRQGSLSPTPDVTDVLLATVDALRALRDEVVSLQLGDVDVDALLVRLRDLAAACTVDVATSSPQASARDEGHLPLSPEERALTEGLRQEGHTILSIQIMPLPDTFAPAARLLSASLA